MAHAQVLSRFAVLNEFHTGVLKLVVDGVGDNGRKRTEIGTGFVVARDGQVLTAAHLLGAASDWDVEIKSGAPRRTVSAFRIDRGGQRIDFPELEVVDDGNGVGIAILRLRAGPYTWLRTSFESNLQVGTTVYALGYAESELRPMAGTIEALADPVQPGAVRVRGLGAKRGDSGGPVVDADGRIIGIIESGKVFESASYFLPLSTHSKLQIAISDGVAAMPTDPLLSRSASDEVFVSVLRRLALAAKDGFAKYRGGFPPGSTDWLVPEELPWAKCHPTPRPRLDDPMFDPVPEITCEFYSGDNYPFAAQTFERVATLLEDAFPTWVRHEANRTTFDTDGYRWVRLESDGVEVSLRLRRDSTSRVVLEIGAASAVEVDQNAEDECLAPRTTNTLFACAWIALARDPAESPRWPWEFGSASSDRREARRLAEMGLLDDPRSPNGNHLLAVVALHERSFAETERYARLALEFRTVEAAYPYQLMLARALDLQNKAEEAIPAYRAALGLSRWSEWDRESLEIRRRVATLLLALKRVDEAIAEYRHVVTLAPDAVSYRELGAALTERAFHGSRDLREARAAFERAIAIEPRNAANYTALGLSLSRAGKNRDAIKAFEKAMKLEPTDPVTHFQLGVTLNAAGKREQAAQTLRQYLDLAALDVASERPRIEQAQRLLAELRRRK